MKLRKMLLVAIVVSMSTVIANPSFAGKGNKPSGGDKTSYNVVTLIPPDTVVWESRVGDMNELNDVGGYYREELDGTPFPFYYDFLNDDFITLPGTGFVSGVNNHREAVGGNEVGGLYWATPQATPIPLPPLQTGDSTKGNDINDAGIITGVSGGSAVVWSVDGATITQPLALGTLPDDHDASAYRLTELDNGSLLVVGKSSRKVQIDPNDPDSIVVLDLAVVWEVSMDGNAALSVSSGPVSLGTLNGGFSEAYAVNSSGDVCGDSDNWPFLKSSGKTMLPLPGLRNTYLGWASDVNDDGSVVGSLRIQDRWGGISDQRAVLWGAAGVMDLSKAAGRGSGWEKLEIAYEINGAGSVAGIGIHPIAGSGTAAYLLTPK
jgi:hypothetical protein